MPTLTVRNKGQVTIPIELRRALKIKDGDRLVLTARRGDEVTFLVVHGGRTLEDLWKSVPPAKANPDGAAEEAWAESAAERYRRSNL